MKHTISIILAGLLLAVISVKAQDQDTFTEHLKTRIDIFTDLWQNTPDALNEKTINRGINIYSMYAFPIKNSNFSIDLGAGFGSHNLYHDNNVLEKDEQGNTQFGVIPDTLANGAGINVNNAKMNFTYLDIPLEFKIETENAIRAAIGFKVGMLINSMSKYKGDNYIDGSGDEIKLKEKNLDNVNRFRYGPTVRVGYKWIDLSAYYSLSTLFEENKGPEMYPVSVGISLVKF
jgi:uncharacterized membrane protein YciS (DUF1049 family)